MDASASVNVFIAQSKEDVAAVHRLRYDVYCHELHSLDARDYPDGKERDKYDEYSVHLIAKIGGEIAGAMRLVRDNPHGFLMEERFTLPTAIDRSKMVEHSRLVIGKKYRGMGLLPKLLEKAYEWQREHGFTICVGAAVMDTLGPILLKHGYKLLSNEIVTYHNCPVLPVVYYLDDGTAKQ